MGVSKLMQRCQKQSLHDINVLENATFCSLLSNCLRAFCAFESSYSAQYFNFRAENTEIHTKTEKNTSQKITLLQYISLSWNNISHIMKKDIGHIGLNSITSWDLRLIHHKHIDNKDWPWPLRHQAFIDHARVFMLCNIEHYVQGNDFSLADICGKKHSKNNCFFLAQKIS